MERELKSTAFSIGGRMVGQGYRPFVVAEVGINHGGDLEVAKQIALLSNLAGADAVKFQCHIPDEEMIDTNVTPINSKEPLYKLIKRCSFTEEQERELKDFCEGIGAIYLSTPFSKAAVDRLERLGVCAYKIGSGEVNNLDFVDYVASKGKPVIMSTGMSSMYRLEDSVNVLKRNKVDYALLHCVSAYPTPPECVGLGKMISLANDYPGAVIGYSDHTEGVVACISAMTLGAQIIEKHVVLPETSVRWEDSMMDEPDYILSADHEELAYINFAADEIFVMQELTDNFKTLRLEQQTAMFAFGSVVAVKDILAGYIISEEDVAIKRPGTGEIKAKSYREVVGRMALDSIPAGTQVKWEDLG